MKNLIATILVIVFSLFLFCNLSFAGEKTLTFSWDQNITDDFAGWTLYHSTTDSSSGFSQFADITYTGQEATTYSSEQPIMSPDGAETTHWFYLTARDVNGNESEPSNVVDVTIDFASPESPFTFEVKVKSQ